MDHGNGLGPGRIGYCGRAQTRHTENSSIPGQAARQNPDFRLIGQLFLSMPDGIEQFHASYRNWMEKR